MITYWQHVPTKIKITLKVLVLVGIVGFLLDMSVVAGMSIHRPTVPNKVDAVVILGAKVGTPALKYRALAGLKYYQEGRAATLVLSGARGPGEPTSEAAAMEKVIQTQVAKTHGKMPHLLLETKSTNTWQNLRNSKALIPNAQSVVVVSDCYHLARSVVIAKKVGFHQVYWNAPKPSYYSDADLAYYYIREAAAMIAYMPRFM